MPLLGAARDAKVAPHLCGIVVGIRRCPTLPKNVRTWLPIRLSPGSPQRSPRPCKTESGDLLIQVPPAASNDMATVVVLVVSKGGNPAAGPNRKRHWTGWFGRHLPASLLLPVF